LYELVLTHKKGDLSRVTRSSLERVLQQKYGPGVRVLDWGKRGGDLVIRLEVKEGSTSPKPSSSTLSTPPPAYGGAGCGSLMCPQPMAGEIGDYIYPSALPIAPLLPLLPNILTAAAIVAVLLIIWQISTEIKETVKLIPEPARGIAVSGTGIGVAALGVAFLLMAANDMRGRRAK